LELSFQVAISEIFLPVLVLQHRRCKVLSMQLKTWTALPNKERALKALLTLYRRKSLSPLIIVTQDPSIGFGC
jgi:hypothetical protein